MSVYGIISEFNPFHNGHKYIVEQARARGANAVVCIMSGNAVERGELAVVDKYYRAEMALECGADLVLELPYPWCASGAESFARAGVAIASEFCDTLIFGSESGDINKLSRAAKICCESDFVEEYRNTVGEKVGAAEAYFELLGRKTGDNYSSNDILGIEYIKSATYLGSAISFDTVTRCGSAYLAENISYGSFQSATALRKLMRDEGIDGLSGYIPKSCLEILNKARESGDISDASKLELAMKLFFRMKDASELEGIAELDEGLASRICQSARASGEIAFIDGIKTKRYTDSRIRRALLFALTGVKREDVKAAPSYVNLLGANSVGRNLLGAKRKTSSIKVLAKAADVPDNLNAKRQAELTERLDSIFTLALDREAAVSDMIKKSPVII